MEIIEKNKCCGCHACSNICPKGAITMIEDEKGFKYPQINKDKCVGCGLCKKVCPIINSKNEIKNDIKSYACYNKNEDERLKSSSGGIFILIAKEIIKREGVVFGASFDEKFNVQHSCVESEKDLEKFMGSKYCQSTIGNTYKKVKDFLDNDRYVLFSGTPCQIEGLKAYLRKDYDKLYTQDIICHGVPSPKVWQKYLDYQKNKYGENIKCISFRNKDSGWKAFKMKILFSTKQYSNKHSNDLFMRFFLNNTCLRSSCYNCSFKKKYRISDICLADYWGIKDIHPEMYDNKGTSLVIVNTSKGLDLFDSIKRDINYIETNLDSAIKYNSAMIKSVSTSVNDEEFKNDLENKELSFLAKKYLPKKHIISKLKNKTKRKLKSLIKIGNK